MDDDQKLPELMKTIAVPERELERLQSDARAQPATGHSSLVVYYRDGVRAAPLLEGERLVVGRSYPAGLPIRDPSLSRQHAALEVIDGEVWIEDLASTNGTRLDGVPVERSRVAPGAEITPGAVVATVQLLPPGEAPSVRLTGHDAFVRELQCEVHRALAHSRGLSLLMVQGERSGEGAHLSRWLPQITGGLAPYHRVAIYGPNTAEALLPETTDEEARHLAATIVSTTGALRCGVAALSHRVRSAEALIEAAVGALQQSGEADRVSWSSTPADSVEPPGCDFGGEGPVARSEAMRQLFETVARLATSTIPVLIEGETGTGKEVVARAIHEGGPRRGAPLVAVNCGAIPPQLVESTLFGHERGAFTGASQRAAGIFESAHGGTVLLDEVGELPPAAQAALLRVLETKRVTRVGSTGEVEVDTRVLAATNRDLAAMSGAGEFREDLLYRLDAMALKVPPLRERLEEIEALAERFVRQANEANGCAIGRIAPPVLELLRRYAWPGNVRELRNVVERAVVIAQGTTIEVEDLPERIRQLGGRTDLAGGPLPLRGEATATDQPDDIDLRGEVARFEVEHIVGALERHGWDRKAAAQSLGLPVRTLSHKMQSHGIKR